ncbi:MAG TPA: coenzyme F420-0:L-glutamate ligase [Polyangiaceae bacterium]|jgi:coenzyme F420-0:L-glutamate ligase/coenzyme F420-1:gamma-L-glutamate ligase
MITCSDRLEALAVPGLPLVGRGDDVPGLVWRALVGAGISVTDGDVLVVTSKLLSRAEGRFVELPRVEPSARAVALAQQVGKDARQVELILRESTAVSRQAPGVLVVRHRLGFVVANAGIDSSNAVPPDAAPGSGPWALLLPEAPDASAAQVRARVERESGARVGVVVTDSFGRPFRVGTVGVAIGVSGLPPVWDRRGEPDLFGRVLENTITALADQVAAVADLVAGQAAERRPLVLVRGLRFEPSEEGAAALLRSTKEDLYA